MEESSRCLSNKAVRGGKFWVRKEDPILLVPVCSAFEAGGPYPAEAFVRIWRSERPDDVSNRCLRHAQEEEAIFLVEPICRKDFHSAEYESLLEKRIIGRQSRLATA